MDQDNPISELQEAIGHEFTNPSLLLEALTHSSTGSNDNYERLEFLGDRVLGLVISEVLYEKFPYEKEGDLAKRLASLVQGTWLAQMAQKIELGRYMQFSEAERTHGGFENDNILADGMEAVIGALYLDGGFLKSRQFILDLWGDAIYEMRKPPQHPKTALQEWAQGQGLALPSYTIKGQSGPDHAPLFDVELIVPGFEPLVAQGRSRQLAEKEVAALFLQTHAKDL